MQALGLVWGNLDPINAGLKELRSPIEAPTHFGAKLLLDHWRAREAHGGFVVGRDVPSRPLASILRNLAIYEPIEEESDFRVRLAGTAFIRRFGRDITGLKLSEIYEPASFTARRATLVEVTGSPEPHMFDVTLQRDDRVFLKFEAIRLRVFSPNRKQAWVLASVFYSDWT